MLNKIMLIGNLGRDPETRYTRTGKPVTHFSLAVSRRVKDPSGERHEETDWFRVVTWERLAEICASYLHKGSKVAIQGRITARTYTDSNGMQRTIWEVTASDMQLLDRKPLQTAEPAQTTAA